MGHSTPRLKEGPDGDPGGGGAVRKNQIFRHTEKLVQRVRGSRNLGQVRSSTERMAQAVAASKVCT